MGMRPSTVPVRWSGKKDNQLRAKMNLTKKEGKGRDCGRDEHKKIKGEAK